MFVHFGGLMAGGGGEHGEGRGTARSERSEEAARPEDRTGACWNKR